MNLKRKDFLEELALKRIEMNQESFEDLGKSSHHKNDIVKSFFGLFIQNFHAFNK